MTIIFTITIFTTITPSSFIISALHCNIGVQNINTVQETGNLAPDLIYKRRMISEIERNFSLLQWKTFIKSKSDHYYVKWWSIWHYELAYSKKKTWAGRQPKMVRWSDKVRWWAQKLPEDGYTQVLWLNFLTRDTNGSLKIISYIHSGKVWLIR